MPSAIQRLRKGKGKHLVLSAPRKARKGTQLARWREEQRKLKSASEGVAVQEDAEMVDADLVTSEPVQHDFHTSTVRDSIEDDNVDRHSTNFMQGRRMVNVRHIKRELQDIDHSPFNCSLKDLDDGRGESHPRVRSCVSLSCRTRHAWTGDDSADGVNTDSSAVAGATSSRGGFDQTEEVLAAADVPCTSSRSCEKHHARACDWWKPTASREMEAAAKTEAAAAIGKGKVDTDRTPLPTAVADGSWCERSYPNNYSLLSSGDVGTHGVASLTGDHAAILEMAATAVLCTSCKTKEKAVARCYDCAHFLCPNCNSAHQFMRCFEDHKVVAFEELKKSREAVSIHKSISCVTHPSENVRHFCDPCQPIVKQEILDISADEYGEPFEGTDAEKSIQHHRPDHR